MGVLSGKTTTKRFKSYPNLKKKPYLWNHIWARDHFVNRVGLDKEMIHRYVKYQVEEVCKAEQDGLNIPQLTGRQDSMFKKLSQSNRLT